MAWLRSAVLLGAAILLLTACASTPQKVPPPTAGTPVPSLALRDVQVEPVERHEAAIGFAFDADQAAELVQSVPDEIDFGTDALLCVFLGERQTDGWALDLRSASLTEGELRIAARETAPRDGGKPGVTYPADCALIQRAALPAGELPVRADDTITDEFITDAVVQVPSAGAAP